MTDTRGYQKFFDSYDNDSSDQSRLGPVILDLFDCYNRGRNDRTVQAYIRHLSRFETGILRQAVDRLIRTSKFCPSISELIYFCENEVSRVKGPVYSDSFSPEQRKEQEKERVELKRIKKELKEKYSFSDQEIRKITLGWIAISSNNKDIARYLSENGINPLIFESVALKDFMESGMDMTKFRHVIELKNKKARKNKVTIP